MGRMRLGHNKERSYVFFIEDSFKIHPGNFVHNILDFIFIFRHTNKLSLDAVLALFVTHKAININDKELDSALESNVVCITFSIMDDKKYLSRARLFDESFGQFIALNTEQLSVYCQIVTILASIHKRRWD